MREREERGGGAGAEARGKDKAAEFGFRADEAASLAFMFYLARLYDRLRSRVANNGERKRLHNFIRYEIRALSDISI